jgi:hypothetical protein
LFVGFVSLPQALKHTTQHNHQQQRQQELNYPCTEGHSPAAAAAAGMFDQLSELFLKLHYLPGCLLTQESSGCWAEVDITRGNVRVAPQVLTSQAGQTWSKEGETGQRRIKPVNGRKHWWDVLQKHVMIGRAKERKSTQKSEAVA